MAEKSDLGTAKRFGARYGKKPKQIFAEIEKLQRTKNKCPYCHYIKVRRIAYGIWFCEKCKAKFTGRAYTISDILPTEKAKLESVIIEETPNAEESYEDDYNNNAETKTGETQADEVQSESEQSQDEEINEDIKQ